MTRKRACALLVSDSNRNQTFVVDLKTAVIVASFGFVFVYYK